MRNVWKPLLVSAALAFLYAAVLQRLGLIWWTDDNYSHGLLMPFIVGYMLWTERARLASATKRPLMLWGGAGIILAWLMLWMGTAGAELFTQRVSLVLMLAGVVLYFWGFHVLRFVVVPLLLLALAIPVPAIIFNKVAFPLQLFASRCAVGVMRLLDIPVLREGNVIELMPLNSLTTKKLEVVEACSGIRSLMTLVTLAVVFAYFTTPSSGDDDAGAGGSRSTRPLLARWGFWRAVLIVLSAVPIAIVTNAARVSGTGALAHFYGPEVADGFFHSFSGWVVYVAAFLLLFAFGWLLDRLVPAEEAPVRGDGEESAAIDRTANGAASVETIGQSSAATLPVTTTEAR